MADKNLQLNLKLYEVSVEQISTRQGFGEGLLAAGEADNQVVALTADLKDSTKINLFAEKWPERFFEVGIAEQNLAAVASGLAAMGKIPFVASYAIFSPGRNWEQIRTTICLNGQNVKIVGSHGGLSVGPDGSSHQALEDIALMRVLPRMTVVVPCDALEAKKATIVLAKRIGPAYLRLARDPSPVITSAGTPFEVGKANILLNDDKPDVAVIACGPLVYTVLRAVRKLAKEGVRVVVVNNHTIKPLDEEAIVRVAKKAKAIVTVEDHQQAGGLGGAVAELLARHYPVPMEFVGVADRFGESGSPAELYEHYGLSTEAIIAAVKKVMKIN